MTAQISDTMLETLAARGLDEELVVKHGLASKTVDGGECLIIPFVQKGEVVRRKYRTFGEAKKFWQDKGGVRCAWNEDALRDDSMLSLPLVITEGELDALAAIQAGFPRTVSVPDGAPPANEDRDPTNGTKYDWLQPVMPFLHKDRAPEIILAVDGDANGAALLHDLSLLLGKPRCKFLTYPKSRRDRGRERCKDLNEVLQDYGVRGVQETIGRAQFLKVEGVFRMSELPPLPAPVVYEIGFPLLSENYRMRLGDLAVVTGIPSYGKTTFVNDVVCRVVDKYGVNVAWASFEQQPQRDHRRNLEAWKAGPQMFRDESDTMSAERWIEERHRFLLPVEDEDVTLDWLLDRMEGAVVQHGCKIVVVDPWNEMDHLRERDETITEYTGRAIKTLKRFARAFQVHLIVVAHPTKQQKDGEGLYRAPSLYDISDSAHWYNKPDIGIIVHRSDKDTTHIKVQKSRYHDQIGKPGTVAMQYCHDDRRFRETERVA